jgi:hypothetical protein
MAALPVEIRYGIYLGVLTVLVPALVGFDYVTGITTPERRTFRQP